LLKGDPEDPEETDGCSGRKVSMRGEKGRGGRRSRVQRRREEGEGGNKRRVDAPAMTEGPLHPVLSEKIPKEMVAMREIQPATEERALAC
jgi:hypothetical protein